MPTKLNILLTAVLATGGGPVSAQIVPPDPAERTRLVSAEANQIVAKVNKAIITRRDVEREIWDWLKNLEQDPLKSPAEKIREYQFAFLQKLRSMITNQLTVQIGREAGLEVPEEYVERRLQQRAEEVEGLPRLVQILGERGMDLDDFRQSIEEDALVQEVMYTLGGVKPAPGLDLPTLDTYVGPRAVYEYYQRNQTEFRHEAAHKVSMIMITQRSGGRPQAEEIQRRARAGESFAQLAREHSTHKPTAEQGGQFGDGEWLYEGDMREEWEEAIAGLPQGGISEIIDIAGKAYFVLRVDDKRSATVAAFDEVQDRIMARLREQQLRENIQRIEKKLMEDAYIWPETLLRSQ